jgi:division protein CdvB (Snf7/Vps24/ESCRT-III family)
MNEQNTKMHKDKINEIIQTLEGLRNDLDYIKYRTQDIVDAMTDALEELDEIVKEDKLTGERIK